MISVIELRKKEEIKKLPDAPGVYKFWGDEEILCKISEKLEFLSEKGIPK